MYSITITMHHTKDIIYHSVLDYLSKMITYSIVLYNWQRQSNLQSLTLIYMSWLRDLSQPCAHIWAFANPEVILPKSFGPKCPFHLYLGHTGASGTSNWLIWPVDISLTAQNAEGIFSCLSLSWLNPHSAQYHSPLYRVRYEASIMD